MPAAPADLVMVHRRVAHVVRSDSFAGVERYICNVATELVQRGWQVDVVGGEPQAMTRALPDAVRFTPARTTGQVLSALRRSGSVPLLHTHMTAAELAGVLARPLLGGSRVVTTRHFAGPRGTSWAVRASGRALRALIAREIAISSYVAHAVGGRPLVLLNGVPDDATTPDLSTNRTILVLQRLQVEKDTETALRAFAASGLANAGWRMVIGGRGAQQDELRRLAGHLVLHASVEMPGFVHEPESLRQAAAIFLATAPSEPFGLSVAEAMAAGLPVVAADGGAHAEVLGGVGHLFRPRDVAGCAALLRLLATDAELRGRAGAAARDRQRSVLSVRAHVDVLERLYLETLEPSARLV